MEAIDEGKANRHVAVTSKSDQFKALIYLQQPEFKLTGVVNKNLIKFKYALSPFIAVNWTSLLTVSTLFWLFIVDWKKPKQT